MTIIEVEKKCKKGGKMFVKCVKKKILVMIAVKMI